jgi:hypothetical protein
MQFPYGRRVPMQERIATDAIIAICSTVAVTRSDPDSIMGGTEFRP